jgi:hypothetical protein
MRLEQAGTPIGGNDLLISVRLADVFGWQRLARSPGVCVTLSLSKTLDGSRSDWPEFAV